MTDPTPGIDEHMLRRGQTLEDEPHVWIKWDAEHEMWACGDEDGYFASASKEDALWPYVRDLMYGAGTMSSESLVERCEATDG